MSKDYDIYRTHLKSLETTHKNFLVTFVPKLGKALTVLSSVFFTMFDPEPTSRSCPTASLVTLTELSRLTKRRPELSRAPGPKGSKTRDFSMER